MELDKIKILCSLVISMATKKAYSTGKLKIMKKRKKTSKGHLLPKHPVESAINADPKNHEMIETPGTAESGAEIFLQIAKQQGLDLSRVKIHLINS